MSPELFHDLVKRLTESNMCLVIKKDTKLRRAISVGNQHLSVIKLVISFILTCLTITIFRRTVSYNLAFLCDR